ncbi:hypothetical protein D3C72_2276700 [compost metagenome]
MSAKFGDIDISQILDNEFRIGVLENVIDLLVRKNSAMQGFTQREIDDIRISVANSLKVKYPNSGIEYRKKD